MPEVDIVVQTDGSILVPAEVGEEFISRVLKPISSDPEQLDNFVEITDSDSILGDSVLCG
jgi:hypothetical protein